MILILYLSYMYMVSIISLVWPTCCLISVIRLSDLQVGISRAILLSTT